MPRVLDRRVALLLVLAACGPMAPTKPDSGDVVIADNVYVLDEPLSRSGEMTDTTLSFPRSRADALSSRVPGDIIVSSAWQKPFMRRIVAMEQTNDAVLLTTERASLDDILLRGIVDIDSAPERDCVETSSGTLECALSGDNVFAGIQWGSNKILASNDVFVTTSPDTHVRLEVKPHLTILKPMGVFESASLTIDATLDVVAALDFSGRGIVKASVAIPLGRPAFKVIGPFWVGYVPIFAIAEAKAEAGVELQGILDGDFTAGGGVLLPLAAGYRITNEGISPIASATPNFFPIARVGSVRQAQLTGEVFLKGKGSIKLEDAIGPYLEAKAYGKISAARDPMCDIDLRSSVGTKCSAGLEVGVPLLGLFGVKPLARYEVFPTLDVCSFEKEVGRYKVAHDPNDLECGGCDGGEQCRCDGGPCRAGCDGGDACRCDGGPCRAECDGGDACRCDGGCTDGGRDGGDGGSDAGLDAGSSDAGRPDAGSPDSGAPDAGSVDAGPNPPGSRRVRAQLQWDLLDCPAGGCLAFSPRMYDDCGPIANGVCSVSASWNQPPQCTTNLPIGSCVPHGTPITCCMDPPAFSGCSPGVCVDCCATGSCDAGSGYCAQQHGSQTFTQDVFWTEGHWMVNEQFFAFQLPVNGGSWQVTAQYFIDGQPCRTITTSQTFTGPGTVKLPLYKYNDDPNTSNVEPCGCRFRQHRCGTVCVPNDAISWCGAGCNTCPTSGINRFPTCDPVLNRVPVGSDPFWPTQPSNYADWFECGEVCALGFHDCGGACVYNGSVLSCGQNCGACFTPQNGTARCEVDAGAGACSFTCDPGFHACGQGCAANDSVDSCGSSCTPCPTMSGFLPTCTSGICGLEPDRTPARFAAAMASLGGTAVLFGGSDVNGFNDETYVWDGGWQAVSSAVRPLARDSHAMATLGNKVVMFGGAGYDDGGVFTYFGDTWEFDGTSWQLKAPATRPTPRSNHAMATLGNRIILYGGFDNASGFYRNDVWAWDGITWRALPAGPPPRGYHGLASLGATLLLFGGEGIDSAFNYFNYDDTWEFDGGAWVQRSATPKPSPRAWFGLTGLGTTAVLFGGLNRAGVTLGDTWVWTGAGWQARSTSSSMNDPVPRHAPAMAPLGSTVLMSGGADNNRILQDSWLWDGGAWSLR